MTEENPTKNKFLKKLYLAIVIILLLLICGLGGKIYTMSKEKEQLSSALNLADLENQKFKVKISKNGKKITSQKQVILTQKQALKNNLLTIEDLKKYKPKAKVKWKTKTVYKDTLFIPYEPIDTANIDGTKLDFIAVPRKFKYTFSDKWMDLDMRGNILKKGVMLDTLRAENRDSFSLLIADKKLGIFKKNIPEVVLTSENPRTSTESLNNVQVEQIKPFYKKGWFWFALGVAGGVYIAK